MRQVLAKVTTEGTAKGLSAQSPYTLAGKTATAYHPKLGNNKLLGGETNVGSFVGFAPVDQPRVAIYVAVIDTDGDPLGAKNAAPVFAKIATETLQWMGVPPDRK